ncbi:MAG: aminopeptidase [Chloroflexi bacterium B3_Chlor]|nr:MAG: aminopeptidase [Chloroflexi bacterium B3_Chlor]
MGTIREGAEQAVTNCARVQPRETTVIITDYATEHIAAALKDVAETISPGNVTTLILEHYGDRPDDGSNPLSLPDEIVEALQHADVSFFAATAKKGEVGSLRLPMTKLISDSKRLRHAHMPGITDELMRMGMCADYKEVQKISARVGDIVKEATHITVTSPAGTEFTAEFSPSLRWVVCDGVPRPGKYTNLPDGEVLTCPHNISKGVIVVDGILGDYFGEKFGLLEDNPVTLDVQDGRVVKVSCADDQLLRELEQYTRQDEHADRFGEFAIGTNTGVDRLVGNMLQDEKLPGVHVAVGHPPQMTGATWESKVHLDGVLKNVTIDVEGYVIMRDGQFTF